MDNASPLGIQLQDLNRDIERLAPPARKRSWLQNIIDSKQITPSAEAVNGRPGDLPRAGSTLTVFVKWASGSKQPTLDAESATSGMRPAQNSFIHVVTRKELHSENLALACKWYTSFLESKIREAWTPLFQPLLVDIRPSDQPPCENDIIIAFEFLTAVVLEFTRKDLALVEIVDELYNKRLLKDPDHDTEHDRSYANQLVFTALGWISLLYSPEPKPQKNFLQIIDQSQTEGQELGVRRSPRYKSKTFTSYRQTLDNKDQPLYTLLRRFGKIIPEYNRDISITQESPGDIPGRHDRWIDLSLVCFHTLHKVASVKIEWVDCLSLHLEFDSRTKILKLFRFPSLCLVMCCDRNQSLMSRIFQDSAASSEGPRTETDDACEFFKEVLLSYRLIFGQTKSSYKDFNNQARKWGLESKNHPDPLLYILCGHSWESDEARHIYDEIEAEDPSNHYSPISDFPFLGKRLQDLQSYVRGHNPHNFMALWFDRRDVSWWWTFWAILQIMQVVLAVKQLDQVPPDS